MVAAEAAGLLTGRANDANRLRAYDLYRRRLLGCRCRRITHPWRSPHGASWRLMAPHGAFQRLDAGTERRVLGVERPGMLRATMSSIPSLWMVISTRPSTASQRRDRSVRPRRPKVALTAQILGSRSKYSSSSFAPPSPLPICFSDWMNSIRSIHFTIL